MSNVIKKLEQLNTLIELSSLINSSLDPGEVSKRAVEAAVRLLEVEAGSLILIDPDSEELFFEVALGDKGARVKEIRLKKGQGIAGWVAEKGEPVIVQDVQSDPRFFKLADEKSKFTTRDMVCVPVKSKDKILGVLQAINKKNGIFDEQDKDALLALANQVAIAIDNANLYQELKEAFYGTAEALAETIEKRDPYTGGHTRRVMNYCLMIGKSIGLSEKELEDLRLAAILHDVGKIGVRDDILLNKNRLTREEFELMIMHSRYGAEILGHIKQLKDIIPGVRSHHERIDGKGYPDNLKNGDIPLMARIIAVADTFDALTAARPYGKAISIGAALKELRKNAGIQFDKDIVDTFTKLYQEKRYPVEFSHAPRFSVDAMDIHGKIMFSSNVEIVNIGICGVLLALPKVHGELGSDESCTVKIESNDEVLTIQGTVVRSELNESYKDPRGKALPVHTVALQFMNLSTEEITDIEDFIRRYVVASQKQESFTKSDLYKMSGLRMYSRFRIDASENATLYFYNSYKVKNLGQSGMIIETEQALEIKDKLPMEMTFPENKRITFDGRVVSCFLVLDTDPERYEVGIEFINMSEESQERLKEFISSLPNISAL